MDFFLINCHLDLDTYIPILYSRYRCGSAQWSHFFVHQFMMHLRIT